MKLNKIEELDNKRTQGDWHYREKVGDEGFTEVVPRKGWKSPDGWEDDNGYNICDNEHYYPTPVEPNDMEFIATAPRMAAMLLKLKNIRDNGVPESFMDTLQHDEDTEPPVELVYDIISHICEELEKNG